LYTLKLPCTYHLCLPPGNSLYVLDLADTGLGNLVSAGIYNAGGVIYWSIVSPSSYATYYGSTVSPNTWYSIQLMAQGASSSAGVATMWVNDNQILSDNTQAIPNN
jgi:hypothetical protein